MPVSVTVSTSDGDPAAAPYKVARRSGKDQATVSIGVTGPGPVRAWMLRRDSTTVTTGTRVRSGGVVCGLTRCGTAKSLALPNPVTIPVTISADELVNEGANGFGVYVYNGSEFE